METLVVKNFLVVKEANLDVKKFNIIIGSQGTGKSVLAKTLYLLKNLENLIRSHLIKGTDFEVLNKEIKNKFISIFPEYAWKSQNFEILYRTDNISITIKNDNILEFIFSENLVNDYKKISEQFNIIKESIDKDHINPTDDDEFLNILPKNFIYRRHIRKLLNDSNFSPLMHTSHFIPASRAFFSLFYENLFSILSSASNLDPFLMEFGKLYENFRPMYNRHLDMIQDSFPLEFSKKILNGNIVLNEEKCFIVNENQSIELIQASSGQQEALPMLQTLAVLSIISQNTFTFIEEPEAHLFPTSQANIMKLLSFLNNKGQNFFITTHSPYILSEFNNYLYAQDLIKRGLLSLEDFERILPSTSPIDINNISAYKIEDGVLTSIVDQEFSIIDTDELDKASSHASDIYNSLLEFEPQD